MRGPLHAGVALATVTVTTVTVTTVAFTVVALSLAGCGPDRGRRRSRSDAGRAPEAGVSADAGRDAARTDAGADGRPRPDAGHPPGGVCEDVVDVVFVLDISSSMSFVLEELERDISQVATAAAELAPEPHFGFIGYADNHAFAESGSAPIHTSASTLEDAFRRFRRTYTDANRNPGDGPSGPTTQNPICEENSLDALYAAARDFPWRDNATRVIIVATDDTFIEPPDNYGDRDGDGDTTSRDFPREGDYPAVRSLDETIAAVRDARARVFSFTRLQPPPPLSFTRCGTPRRRPWSDVNAGWSQPYDGADPIPARTDGRNYDLDQVRTGSLGLADTISEVVLESYCDEPLF